MIRPATLDDLPRLVEIEAKSWPAGMAADAETLAARLRAFPAGQLVAEVDGQVVAYAAAQRIAAQRLEAQPLTFAELTDHGRFTATHDSSGDVYQLIGVAVIPTERRSGVARALVDRQIAQARLTRGVRRIVGFTRPAGYHRQAQLPLADYLAQGLDPVVSFHTSAGAQIVSAHVAFRPEDRESLGYGVWIEYPVVVD